MRSVCSIGVGLSVVFTCLLLALVAEIYYLLWWKKRNIRPNIEEHDYRNPSTDFLYMFCCITQKSSSAVNISTNPEIHQSPTTPHELHFQKPLFDEANNNGEFITGPPRFLFTINEETKEDMELSEDGKSASNGRRKCLNDLMKNMDNNSNNNNVTPVSSPPFLTPLSSSCQSRTHSNNNGGFYNPFHESSTDAEFSKMFKSSPPPKLKFLRDAEEKLQRKSMLTQAARNEANLREDGSCISIIVAKS